MAIELELSDTQNFILATIYCPNGNPNLSLFQDINNLSEEGASLLVRKVFGLGAEGAEGHR